MAATRSSDRPVSRAREQDLVVGQDGPVHVDVLVGQPLDAGRRARRRRHGADERLGRAHRVEEGAVAGRAGDEHGGLVVEARDRERRAAQDVGDAVARAPAGRVACPDALRGQQVADQLDGDRPRLASGRRSRACPCGRPATPRSPRRRPARARSTRPRTGAVRPRGRRRDVAPCSHSIFIERRLGVQPAAGGPLEVARDATTALTGAASPRGSNQASAGAHGLARARRRARRPRRSRSPRSPATGRAAAAASRPPRRRRSRCGPARSGSASAADPVPPRRLPRGEGQDLARRATRRAP